MNDQHIKALEEAIAWIEENYQPIGIIASGSIIRGNANKDSDFDIYVIHEEQFRQRIQKYFNQTPCEIFINTIEQTQASFLKEQSENRPVTAHMICSGMVIKGNENKKIANIIEEALDFSTKPKILTEFEQLQLKYLLANSLEDANDMIEVEVHTCAYILNRTLDKLVDYWFAINQIPLPRIKERMMHIKTVDSDFYNNLSTILMQSDLPKRLFYTNEIIKNKVGSTGFFEWESKKG